ncbi:MBL fold metallo-hydrolase [Planomicrobium sp. YIM 101495]|uniref:MBL fold metallo-hydrolase n=1 Tax=Planomicrobium sp. YIM 101495 TaxID=2665160 RepID=UPI0012B9627D|nr:MBL fold metallo-hydrolase [Planomicrobium sp. YIM 101495]MTD31418.1 MBL fold metallo-hydrolase [Planomicrobium sp. YIM 101495]
MTMAVLLLLLVLTFLAGCMGAAGPEKQQQKQALEGLTVHYLNVGQADATLLEFNGYTLLIDAGDWNASDVITALDKRGIERIDVAIATHPDADHIGQLGKVLESFQVDEVWMSGNTSTSETFLRVLEGIEKSGAAYEEPTAGDQFEIGDLKIEVLHPAQLTGDANEDSLVLRMTYGDVRFLFTGDAGVKSEKAMIAAGAKLDADILHLGHHGSNTSTSTDFLRAVTPEVAIYSAGAGNSYGHPHAEVIASTENEGATVYGTDVNGTITVTTDGKTYEITTESEGLVTEGENRCLDLNVASTAELQQLDGIGESLAEAIIADRPFDKLEELTRVKGIGAGKLEAIHTQGLACLEGSR